VRRALLTKLPLLTRFYYGAIHPLNIEQLSSRELHIYVVAMESYFAEQKRGDL
jgi:hypothetical protein